MICNNYFGGYHSKLNIVISVSILWGRKRLLGAELVLEVSLTKESYFVGILYLGYVSWVH